jgi:hypothetical protein
VLHRPLFAARLRVCPVCGSRAISGMDGVEFDARRARWMLRCGECETWRAFVVGARFGRVLERRFGRMLERDLRGLERVAERHERAARGAGPRSSGHVAAG